MLARFALVMAVVCAVLLPKVAAVALDIMPSVQSVVICVGDRLVTIRIGPDGQPVEVPEGEKTPCVMSDAVVALPSVAPPWVGMARSYAHAFVIRLNPGPENARLRAHVPPRAPPVVI